MNARTISLTFALLFVVTITSAQTRKIGHRSHSGSSETFAMMMGEDHLGGYFPPEPIYEVDPFIEKVRHYYEQVAKRTVPVQVEATRSQIDSIPTKPRDSPSSEERPKTNSPKGRNKKLSPDASIQDIPPPDFLVKPRREAATSGEVSEGTPAPNKLWMLVGLLAFTVAPGLFVASAIWQRKPKAD